MSKQLKKSNLWYAKNYKLLKNSEKIRKKTDTTKIENKKLGKSFFSITKINLTTIFGGGKNAENRNKYYILK